MGSNIGSYSVLGAVETGSKVYSLNLQKKHLYKKRT